MEEEREGLLVALEVTSYKQFWKNSVLNSIKRKGYVEKRGGGSELMGWVLQTPQVLAMSYLSPHLRSTCTLCHGQFQLPIFSCADGKQTL